jgi:murein DD-endopeptidase MepM/ murein hydrolase activator NlpD
MSTVDDSIVLTVVNIAYKHYWNPTRYDYLGKEITSSNASSSTNGSTSNGSSQNGNSSGIWPNKNLVWFTYKGHGGVEDGSLASDVTTPEGTQIQASYEGEVVTAYYGWPNLLHYNSKDDVNSWEYGDTRLSEDDMARDYNEFYRMAYNGKTLNHGNWTFGNRLLVKYYNVGGRELYFHYCHLRQTPQMSVGQKVKPGDIIGATGYTGNGTGAHLHFEVWASNVYSSRLASPYKYLP